MILSNIQALRAFAALNVMFVHIFMSAGDYQMPMHHLAFLREWGSNGVDIFFVISGFIMFYIQYQKQRSPFTFFRDRVFRIVPLYWSLTLALSAVVILIPSLFRKLSITPEWLFKSLTFHSHLSGFDNPIIFAGWTLEFEMVFYIIFALSLFASSLNRSFLISLILIAIVSVFTHMIVFEFLLGMSVSWLYLHYKSSARLAYIMLFLGIVLLIPSIGIPDLQAWYKAEGIRRVIIWGIPAAMMVFGLVNIKQTSNPLLIALGNASYSIYLIQIITIPAFYKALQALKLGGLDGDVAAMLCFTSTAIAGYVLYYAYERPITLYLKRWNHG